MKLNRNQLLAALKCKTPEELVNLSAERGITITIDETKEILSSAKLLKLTDEDLENVAGGIECAM